MKRYIGFLFGCAVAVASLQPLVARAEFHKGDRLDHVLSVCLSKEDAIEIVKADAEKGRNAASEIWVQKEKCGNVPVVGMTAGETILTVNVKRPDGVNKVARVIEVVNPNGVVIGWFMTTLPLKAERES
jgi:hypothetical protein